MSLPSHASQPNGISQAPPLRRDCHAELPTLVALLAHIAHFTSDERFCQEIDEIIATLEEEGGGTLTRQGHPATMGKGVRIRFSTQRGS